MWQSRLRAFPPKHRARVVRFLRTVFAPECNLLRGLLSNLGRIPLFWLFVVMLSVLLHALFFPLPFFQAYRPAERARKVLPFTVRLLKVRPKRKKPPPSVRPPPQPKAISERLPQDELPGETAALEPLTPRRKRPQQPAVFGMGPGAPAGSGSARRGERETGREAALLRYGGNERTEKAVLEGLRWLVRHQSGDGRWDCDGFSRHCPSGDRCGDHGSPQYDVGVTALALSAFAARGKDAQLTWRRVAEKARSYLLATQRPEGTFGRQEASFMYNQAIAMYALAYTAGVFPFGEADRSLQRALRFVAHAQQAGGGWDYTSEGTGRNDLSCTGWILLAVDACRRRGYSLPPKQLAKALEFVRRMVRPEENTVVYADRLLGAKERRKGLVPVALLSLLLNGASSSDSTVRLLAESTLARLPRSADRAYWRQTGQSLYYWYYGTLALFELGSPYWPVWNRRMQQELLALQRTGGHERGSWDPDPNWIGTVGGRVAATALAVLTLEIYYRVTPRFEGSGKGGSSP